MPNERQLIRHRKAAEIANPDAQGRHADFHSLRYFFCTVLAKVMPIHRVQLFMRHSDVRMTSGLYMDLGLSDLWAAAQSIPSLNLTLPAPLPPTLPLPQHLEDSQENSTMSV
jgi:integrase